jgi:hypothetical protein
VQVKSLNDHERPVHQSTGINIGAECNVLCTITYA